jgi:hypothetical protein
MKVDRGDLGTLKHLPFIAASVEYDLRVIGFNRVLRVLDDLFVSCSCQNPSNQVLIILETVLLLAEKSLTSYSVVIRLWNWIFRFLPMQKRSTTSAPMTGCDIIYRFSTYLNGHLRFTSLRTITKQLRHISL